MGAWHTRGLRGSTFESMINMTNEQYREKGLAVIQKIPTPITPIRLNPENKTISLAYFEKKSTVDYIGAVQGFPICFDAKETGHKRFPLQNIHEHQIHFMEDFQKQQGIAFLLIRFQIFDEIYYLPFSKLKKYWIAAQANARKSIPYSDFDKQLVVKGAQQFLVHYLEALNIVLSDPQVYNM